MSFRFPPRNHPARAHYDQTTIHAVLAAPERLQTYVGAVSNARREIKNSAPPRKVVHTICLRANDERWLIMIGRRGGIHMLWNFGTGLEPELVRVPKTFIDDHMARCLPTPRIVQELFRWYLLDRDDPEMPELISDARHYAEGGLDAAPGGIVRSAKVLLSILQPVR